MMSVPIVTSVKMVTMVTMVTVVTEVMVVVTVVSDPYLDHVLQLLPALELALLQKQPAQLHGLYLQGNQIARNS